MKKEEVMKRLEIQFSVSGYISYANYRNQRAFKPIYFEIKNISRGQIEGVSFRISSSNNVIEPYEEAPFTIAGDTTIRAEHIFFKFDTDYLLSLTESEDCVITFELLYNNEVVYKQEQETEITTFDYWRSAAFGINDEGEITAVYPTELKALLSAFVTPNHPTVKELAISSSKWLKEWTGDPSFDGYQSHDPNRVKQMVAAIYAAIQQKNLIYSEPPTSFGMGQRIRLADDIMEQHVGTCMDLSVLFASCLESIGLHPILILHKGHIYCGCWLVEDCFKDGVVEDYTQVTKRLAKGINEVVIFECTAVCSGHTVSFEEACSIAERTIEEPTFDAIIDIHGLRIYYRYRPLPIRVKEGSSLSIAHEEREEAEVTDKADDINVINLDDIEKKELGKVQYWERKLLDLSTRNTLINTRFKNVLRIVMNDPAEIEDKIFEGNEFVLGSFQLKDTDDLPIEALADIGKSEEFVKESARQNVLFAFSGERAMNTLLTKLYRQAVTAKEETGTSTLYMAIGFLRWVEGSAARYAPLVLVPIDILRRPGKGYIVVKRDEDTEFNVTLLEMLRQNYRMDINGLDPVPEDEHGVDMDKIMLIMRRAIMNKDGWDIINAAVIGNFSFTQFVMWRDLHKSSDKLAKNKLVRSLISGAVDWDTTIPDDVDEGEVYLPISADDSQLHAIKMAEKGCTFVLHGPPGTGKSQTITAMIANALAKGKTVLFVAEKMAALEVVDHRLSVLGLDPFCLELHSTKSSKKNVLEQLEAGINLKYKGVKSKYYQMTVEDNLKARKHLDEYANELHKKQSCGYSLRELIDLYESLDCDEIRSNYKDVYELSKRELDERINMIHSLFATGKEVENVNEEKLNKFNIEEYTSVLRYELEDLLDEYQEILDTIEDKIDANEDLGFKQIETPADWATFKELLNGLLVDKNEEIIEDYSDINEKFDKLVEYARSRKELSDYVNDFESKWDFDFINGDVVQYENRIAAANKKVLFKTKELNNIRQELKAKTQYHIGDDLQSVINQIKKYQDDKNKLQNLSEGLNDEEKLIVINNPNESDLVALRQSELDARKEQYRLEREHQRVLKLKQDTSKKDLIALNEAMNSVTEKEDQLQEKGLMISSLFDNTIEDQRKEIDVFTDGLSDLKDWLSYRSSRNACIENKMSKVVDAYEKGENQNDIINKYNKGLYKALILGVISGNSVLNHFSGASFNEKIRQFKELDDELRDITKDEIYYILANQLPAKYESADVNRELAVLKRAIASKGKGFSIRSLFAQIPHVLTRICPCVLMSPISVAQYLSLEMPPFDIIVFDEASQLPTCKAIGVLARGNSAVVVGDPKQMPPTSFFSSNNGSEDDVLLDDLDSILDDCLALGLPETHLEWHYRSRHESLIAFSNREFYNNKMLTFPSVNDQEKRVKYVKVGGFYDQKKGINEAEAKSIIKEIKRRYKNPRLNKKSIGVITFNIKQQNYIEDLLLEEYKNDIDFDRWANEREEKLFVKNLENVQGDERDIILFSILFGTNQTGKLSLNFGPLNKEGGWKRLNVAASRARQEMVIFSIMSYDMIDLSRTSSVGVAALRSFLEFAERGKLGGAYDEKDRNKEGICNHIVAALKEEGYDCKKDVGHSEFKIDIAVINPYNPEEYILGIMLDGDVYGETKNTRDREVAQLSVLSGLGWTLHRVWTMDFWDDEKKELSKIFKLLEELRSSAESKKSEKDDGVIEPVNIDFTAEDEAVTVRKRAPRKKKLAVKTMVSQQTESVYTEAKTVADRYTKKKYKLVDYPNCTLERHVLDPMKLFDDDNQDILINKINQVITVEAPITYEMCRDKVLNSSGVDINAVAIEAYKKAFKKANCITKSQNGIKWLWSKDQNPDEYYIYRYSETRRIDDICSQELENAVCVTLQEKFVLSEEKLVKETLITLGYFRDDKDTIKIVLKAIRKAKKEKKIIIDSEGKYEVGD